MLSPSLSEVQEDFADSRQMSVRRHNDRVLGLCRRRRQWKDTIGVLVSILLVVGFFELLRFAQLSS